MPIRSVTMSLIVVVVAYLLVPVAAISLRCVEQVVASNGVSLDEAARICSGISESEEHGVGDMAVSGQLLHHAFRPQMHLRSGRDATSVPANVSLEWASCIEPCSFDGNAKLTCSLDENVRLKATDCPTDTTQLQVEFSGHLASLADVDQSVVAALRGVTVSLTFRGEVTRNEIRVFVTKDGNSAWPLVTALTFTAPTTLGANVLGRFPALRSLTLPWSEATIPANTFRAMTQLTSLFLHKGAVAKVSGGEFNGLENLETLDLTDNKLTHFDLASVTELMALTLLRVEHNSLAQFEYTGAPSAPTSNRSLFVDFNDNKMTSLDHICRALPRTTRIEAFSNLLDHTEQAWFQPCSRVHDIDISFNKLKQFDTRHVASCGNLTYLAIQSNELTSVDLEPLARLPHLKRFWAQNNKLASLSLSASASLESLTDLQVQNNELTRLPHRYAFPNLETLLVMKNNLTVELILNSTTLRNVGVDNNTDLPVELYNAPRLRILRARHVKSVKVHDINSLHLDVLTVGYATLNEDTLPAATYCQVLQANASILTIGPSNYSALRLNCESQCNWGRLRVMDSSQLRSISTSCSLDIAFFKQLYQLSTFDVRNDVSVVSIESTNMPVLDDYCTRLGTRAFIARNMSADLWKDDIFDVVNRCRNVPSLAFLDMSNNDALNDIGKLNQLPNAIRFYSNTAEGDLFDPNSPGHDPVARIDVLNAQTEVSTPLTVCDRENRFRFLHDSDNLIHLTQQFTVQCRCASHVIEYNGVCQENDQGVGGLIAAGSLLVLAIVGFSVFMLRRKNRELKRQRTRAREDRERLIYATHEVEALKRAWGIDFEEVHLLDRIDQDTPGAFSEVWKARWNNMDVAVKVMQHVWELDDETREDFDREVQFLRQTRHPNLVLFLGAGENTHGHPFLVLEYVPSGSLTSYLYDMNYDPPMQRQVSNAQKAQLATDIAEGMKFLHSKGHMHRDLKTSNVLVTPEGRAKITDFGTIQTVMHQWRSQRPSATRAKGAVGTPLYMSPEALEGDIEGINFSSDVFSFGVILWEIAMQRIPDLIEQQGAATFRGSAHMQILELLRKGRRLSFNPALFPETTFPEWFASVSEKCTQFDKHARPSFASLVLTIHQTKHVQHHPEADLVQLEETRA
eukprot:m.306613 g.306613  ORF g.306613 m.306613 type:complete len:1138 (-) comp15925_c0_seq3:3203-6616(-)